MDMVKRGDMMSIEDVIDILSIDLIGAVPDDESIVVATTRASRWPVILLWPELPT